MMREYDTNRGDKTMDHISRCEKHDTTFITEEGSYFDRCFVCVFEDNEQLRKTISDIISMLEETSYKVRTTPIVDTILHLGYKALINKEGGE